MLKKVCVFLTLLWYLLGATKSSSQAVYKSVTRISKVNEAIRQAKAFQEAGRFKEAFVIYSLAIDSLGLESEAALLNKGQCALKLGFENEAKRVFSTLASSENKGIQSTALNQLGLLTQTDNEAIGWFKSALKANSSNDAARRNYEIAAKRLKQRGEDPKNQPKPQLPSKQEKDKKEKDKNQSQKPKQSENNQNSQKENEKKPSDNSGQDEKPEPPKKEHQSLNPGKQPSTSNKPKDGKGEKQPAPNESQAPKLEPLAQGSENQGTKETNQNKISANKQKLSEMNLTEEQAKNLLDAMKASEIQYLQQMRRGTKKKASKNSKQDW